LVGEKYRENAEVEDEDEEEEGRRAEKQKRSSIYATGISCVQECYQHLESTQPAGIA